MTTLVVMVSSGRREHLSDLAFSRAARWASRNDYSAVLSKERVVPPDRLPHYAKLLAPDRFPGFGRYCIIDDDLLISSLAPPLPDIPEGMVGLVPDAEQRHTTKAGVKWTGNTGFVLCTSEAIPLLREAFAGGDDPDIWGIA